MHSLLPSVGRFLVVAFALVQAAFAASSTLPVSPFLSASVVAAAPATGLRLEFRGVMADGDHLLFRVVDPSHQIGFWVCLNEHEPALNFVVTRYDPSPGGHVGSRTREAITVEQAGRPFRLELCGAKLASVRGPGSPLSSDPLELIHAVKLNTTPGCDVTLRDAVIAEVKRRREERERSRQ